MSRDLKKGELLSEWRSLASDQRVWGGVVTALVEELNEKAKEQETQGKDEWRKRKEEMVLPGST